MDMVAVEGCDRVYDRAFMADGRKTYAKWFCQTGVPEGL